MKNAIKLNKNIIFTFFFLTTKHNEHTGSELSRKKNKSNKKDVIKINYGSNYNIAQLNAIHVISPLYHLKFILLRL